MELAGHLHMSLWRCQEEVDAREFTWWLAKHEISPIGGYRGDRQSAKISQTLAACHGVRAHELSFLPRFDEPPKNTLAQRLAGMFELLAAGMPLKDK